ncbi:MAG: SNF2-related protein [Lentisphaerota bacterium]
MASSTTNYHAKYFAYELTRAGGQGLDRITQSLFNASVDLNPHQVEAALFALRSPLSKGVLLADEVGLGKTIEAGLVLCQSWAERKRTLMVICPAALRKQWQIELEEKFNLPSIILDAKAYKERQKAGNSNPFNANGIVIASYHFISKMAAEARKVAWDIVVIDEAHKLRNAHQASHVTGQNIRWALNDRRKVLLTATPLQNSLTELYGLSTLIDDQMFGDLPTFRSLYANVDGDLEDLRKRIAGFCRRTLRRNVAEFVRYTARRLITIPFNPTDNEQGLYEAVSRFLQQDDTYAFPRRQRHLIILIVRKLLASSPVALQGTLQAVRSRLIQMRDEEPEVAEQLLDDDLFDDEVFEEYLDEVMMVAEEHSAFGTEDELPPSQQDEPEKIDRRKLQAEIDEMDRFINWSRGIGTDTKTKHLLHALETGWTKMRELGAEEKAVIFTESRRSMEYLRNFLEQNGYVGDVVCFSGGGKRDAGAEKIYAEYMAENKFDSNVNTAGSKAIMLRHALIDRFKRKAKIMIATEAGAEGINLQFCSLVINYDLPWNPQRIEQRIGRCHRYGQKYDVVVINFLNERNAADKRVYELLEHKFQLFDGIFGASDEVLGIIDNSTGLEMKIMQLYQQCRTEAEIQASFDQLQAELEDSITDKIQKVKQQVLENFDEDVHKLLKIDYDDALHTLDEVGRKFWLMTKAVLGTHADFNDAQLSFRLKNTPFPDAELSEYYLKPKTDMRKQLETIPDYTPEEHIIYRMNSPLGEWCIDRAKELDAPCHEVKFDLSGYPAKISVLEDLKGKSGYIFLNRLEINSLDREEYLLFTGFSEDGQNVPHDILTQFFKLDGEVGPLHFIADDAKLRLQADMQRFAEAKLHESLGENNKLFLEQNAKLERWIADCVKVAERELEQTMIKIREVRNQINLAETVEAQTEFQEQLKKLENKKREGRNKIFDVEDEASAKRDDMIKALKRKMVQNIANTPLFTLRWRIV